MFGGERGSDIDDEAGERKERSEGGNIVIVTVFDFILRVLFWI